MIIHFHIHRNPAVQQSLGHMNMQVVDLDFDDLGNDTVVLVSCDPNRWHLAPRFVNHP